MKVESRPFSLWPPSAISLFFEVLPSKLQSTVSDLLSFEPFGHFFCPFGSKELDSVRNSVISSAPFPLKLIKIVKPLAKPFGIQEFRPYFVGQLLEKWPNIDMIHWFHSYLHQFSSSMDNFLPAFFLNLFSLILQFFGCCVFNTKTIEIKTKKLITNF